MGSNRRGKQLGRLKDPPVDEEAQDEEDREEEGSSPSTTSATSKEEEDCMVESSAAPKYQVKEKVYARDAASSLWYEAIIRRSLFGVNHNKQVQIGLVTTEDEIEEILAQSESTPGWHYFVHYNKWNTNWDRWVSEEDIMEENDESKRIADRYLMEHRKLQKEMKKGKGRSSDATAFLNTWSKRMQQIAEELKKEAEEEGRGRGEDKKAGVTESKKKGKRGEAKQPEEEGSAAAAVKSSSKPKSNKRSSADRWDKAAIAREYKLRLRGLEGKRSSQDQHKMTLPFSLKKVMVEAWEIITQCQMVSNLPAKVTVRQGLDKYLQSKLELIVPAPPTTTAAATTNTANSPEGKKRSPGKKEEDPEEKLQRRRQEWIDMAEGITIFFDEALPFRLLYSQELSQYKIVANSFVVPAANDPAEVKKEEDDKKVQLSSETTTGTPDDAAAEQKVSASDPSRVEGQDECSSNSRDSSNKEHMTAATRKMLPSEIYGCEHLLRLCLKVPELLAEQMPTPASDDESGLDALASYEQECKQVLAKVNDLIRFLHKHQSTVFADSYRKLNEAELREDQKFMRSMERKRKRATTDDKPEPSQAQENSTTKATTTDDGAHNNKLQKVS